MDAVTLAAILGIPASVGVVGTYAGRGLRKFNTFMDRLDDTLKPDANGRSISERMDATQAVVAEIKKQVLPNGGNSLRDAVNDAAALAKTAGENAGLASAAAREAVDKAERAEIMGNYERRDIRKKLDDIDAKIGVSTGALTEHLIEAAKTSAEMNNRMENLEKRSA